MNVRIYIIVGVAAFTAGAATVFALHTDPPKLSVKCEAMDVQPYEPEAVPRAQETHGVE